MNSRASWNVDGLDPSVRERAEAAARRAGMPLSEWLNSKLGDNMLPNARDRRPQSGGQESGDVANIHQRLDAITQQIEQISKPASDDDVSREQGVARQLNDAISRLDVRLSQIPKPRSTWPTPGETRQRQADTRERAATQPYRDSPPLSPASLDGAIAEIAARQNELDSFATRPPRAAPLMPSPPVSGPDFSSLEQHLVKITGQIEALKQPDHLEQSAATFRNELAQIGHAITEAMPRRAIESIESEIRSLHRRIDETRSSGNDGQALAGVERTLSEIREVLRSLTPAEQLAGFDEAIHSLNGKLDLILRSKDDPSTVQKLEGAISALRGIVPNVASNEALTRLSEDVQLLSAKVDQISRASSSTDKFFSILEERIGALATSIESRERPGVGESTERLEDAIRALSDRLDHMQVGNDSASTFAHLEQRVSYLLERVEASSDPRNNDLSRVEEGLHDILRYLEKQQAAFASLADRTLADRTPDSADSAVVELVKRELSGIRISQAETDRHTHDSIEAVHNALGHLVGRLTAIEDDLRTVRTAPLQQPMAAPSKPVEQAPVARGIVEPQSNSRLELPNPAATHFAAEQRELHAAPQTPPVSQHAVGEILGAHVAPAHAAIAPELPPNHPLEPGTRPSARTATPLERIAASESAISEIPAPPREPATSSSFIAAARRAAQAAAAQSEQPARGAAKAGSGDRGKAKDKEGKGGSALVPKIRALLGGASAFVIALGFFAIAMHVLDGGDASQNVASSSSVPAPQTLAVDSPRPAPPQQITPSLTSPIPLERQAQVLANPAAPVEVRPAPAQLPAANYGDVTGSIPKTSMGPQFGMVQVPASERLPDGIAGPLLRNAAMKGDSTAAYEVGLRFAEGKGVPVNYDEAAKWYNRAAQAGVVPAIFRLGTLYEKGLGVKKDLDAARLRYAQAAERGNAKAMHNLAVLDADGGGRTPDYKGAAQWFRRAADRGIADSQYNLGILYARGIGVEQNLAESYKWFSLAAAQGDQDAATKRDDVAKRLDPESLAAAKLAIQTFSVEPQPDDAINVATPAGGWDSAPANVLAPASTTKPGAARIGTKRTTAAR